MPGVLVVLMLSALPLSTRERAVMIYPREHGFLRRLFYGRHQRDLRKRLERRFVVDVYEQVATAEELFKLDVQGAKLLVLSGHGSPFAMFFDRRDRRTVDQSDQERLREFFSQLAPDATILLQSCDTGLGFAWTVKVAAGPHRRVIAAEGEIPPDGVAITSLDPVEVTITCRDTRRGAWDCTMRQ